jgi:large subunit ribosomal protein L4
MKAAAVRQALTDRARNNRLHVVESLGLSDKPSTKAAQAFLAMFTKQKNVLVVLDRTDEVSYLSLRNLKNVHVLPVDQLNAYDVLLSDDVVFTKSALDTYIAGPAKGSSVKAVATSKEA